ncbi:MAG: hypothetical protein ACRD23_05910 [Terriglobales bacterium]
MESEKLMYWMTLGMLALATTSGFVSEHRTWGEGLVDHSISLVSQASEIAANAAGIAGLELGCGENDSTRSPRAVAEVRARLACVQHTMVRRQAEMARLQGMRVRVRMLSLVPGTIVLPNQNLVIEVPQPPLPQVDTF